MAFMRTNNIKPNPSALRRSERTVYGKPGCMVNGTHPAHLHAVAAWPGNSLLNQELDAFMLNYRFMKKLILLSDFIFI